MAETWRATAKAHRRQQLLDAAAHLFAERGFNGVSIEELGASAGVSGPALYRHFPSKEAVLGELLIGASQRLLEGCTRILDDATEGPQALRDLVDFHVDFALSERDVIRIQDRELASLPPAVNHEVRMLQRRYVQAWVELIARLSPTTPVAELEVRVHAIFGLLNSTPHNAKLADVDDARGILAEMAIAGVLGAGPASVPAPSGQLRVQATDAVGTG